MDPKRRPLVLAVLHQASRELIDAYKASTFPPALAAELPYSDLEWVNLDKFDAFLRSKDAPEVNGGRHVTSPVDSELSKTIPDSLSARGTPPPVITVKKEPEVIDLCSDGEEPSTVDMTIRLPAAKSTKPGTAKPPNAKGIRVTRDLYVDRVVELTSMEIPMHWPATPDRVAYVVDFNGDDRASKTTDKGKPVGLDSFLKKEDMDSWGPGRNGSTKRDTALTLLNNIPSRRSTHQCNGALRCEFFDTSLFQAYSRVDSEDMELTQRIFNAELAQNARDSVTVEGRAASFLRVVDNYRREGCPRAQCKGAPKLIPYAAVNKSGQTMFIGCSGWRRGEHDHRCAWIPKDVDETLVKALIYGTSPSSPSGAPQGVDTTSFGRGSCSLFRHPKYGKDTACQHPHYVDGQRVTASMVVHECPVRKVVYTSKDPDTRKCVVVIEGVHTHPPWPPHKVGQAAKDDLKGSLAATGKSGVTGGDLNSAHTTKTFLGSSLDVKHAAFRDTRVLRKETNKIKAELHPEGLTWKGIEKMYEDDLKLPIAERYVHDVRREGSTKIAVCMLPELIQLIHDPGVMYAVCDFTFKRTFGELNEWEVAIWYTSQRKRVSVARVFSNHFTKDAYKLLFDAFFKSVKVLTQKEPRFKAFHEDGNLHCILFDMEAAQMQGFGEKLVDIVNSDPELRKLFPNPDPNILVQFVVKLCSVHWERSTKALVASVGEETVAYLNKFLGMSDPAHIAAWHEFCKTHSNKKLRDWYAHKIQYPWLLPCFNESLSKFPPGMWGDTQTHTNLVEGAHARTNRATMTNLMPVESIESARAFDLAEAQSLRDARTTCVLNNRHNHDSVRMRRAGTRAAKRENKHGARIDIADELDQAKADAMAAAAAKKAADSRLKALKAQQKDLGKAAVRGPREHAALPSLLINPDFDCGSDDPPPTSPTSELMVAATVSDLSVDDLEPQFEPNLSSPLETARDVPFSSSPPPILNTISSDDSWSEFAGLEVNDPHALDQSAYLDLDGMFADMSGMDPALDELSDLSYILKMGQPTLDASDEQMNPWFIPEFALPEENATSEWPILPPPPPSPPLESSLATSPGPKGDVDEPAQLTPVVGHKRSRDEVDPENIITTKRVRTTRVRRS